MDAFFAVWITLVAGLVGIGIVFEMINDYSYSVSNQPTEGSIEDDT
jgi:hypothetical protein